MGDNIMMMNDMKETELKETELNEVTAGAFINLADDEEQIRNLWGKDTAAFEKDGSTLISW